MSNGKEKKFWCVSQDHWALPVEVEFPEGNDVVAAKPAEVPLTNLMTDALVRTLDATCFTVRNGRWMLMLDRLEEIAEPLPEGSDPQECVAWSRKIQRVRSYHWRSAGMIDNLYASGKFKSRDQAALCFRVVVESVCDWLVNWRRPVDFGLFEICPIPQRRNWKEVLFSQVLGLRKESFTIREFRHRTLSFHTTALFRRANFFHWTLDIKLKQPWWRANYKKESAVAKRTGQGYSKSHFEQLKATSEKAYEIFMSYLAEIRPPSGRVRWSGRKGEFGLAKIVRGPVLRGRVSSARTTSPTSDRRYRPQSREEDLEAEDKNLPQVSPVRSQVVDVREPRTDVGQPGDGTDPADGVPLLDAPGGEV